MAADLLARIRGELEERMAQLRPLLDEYERLLAAVDIDADTAPRREPTSPAARTALRRGPASPTTRTALRRGPASPTTRTAPRRGRASPATVQRAILAALEHGSHTSGELAMVTALSAREIRAGISRLTGGGAIAKVKRRGDGKSAYALLARHETAPRRRLRDLPADG